MKLVVGLGNPGPQYAGTRHNVGFDVVRQLARNGHADWRSSKFEGELTEILVASQRVLLLAPTTYMNLSGRSVRGALAFYKIPPQDLLVVCDDLNLPVGQLRLRVSGSAGGQKGLQNTIDQLGTQEFCRLRVGVGRPPGKMDAAHFVLQKFSRSEQQTIDDAIISAVLAVETWVREGPAVAMNRFNVSNSQGN